MKKLIYDEWRTTVIWQTLLVQFTIFFDVVPDSCRQLVYSELELDHHGGGGLIELAIPRMLYPQG